MRRAQSRRLGDSLREVCRTGASTRLDERRIARKMDQEERERERAVEIFRPIDRGFEFITDTGSKITATRVIKNILRAPRIAELWRAV